MNRKPIVVVLSLTVVAAVAAAEHPAQEAAELRRNIDSQWKTGNWSGVRPLLEQYVRQYPSTERVPLFYLRLAFCAREAKDTEAVLDAMEQIVRRFYGSDTWFTAYGTKLHMAREAEDREAYLEDLQRLLRQADVAPMNLRPLTQNWRHVDIDRGPWVEWYRGGGRSGRGGGWTRDILWAVDDDPKQAQLVLSRLARTFSRRKTDLPIAWQLAHVRLLEIAEQQEKAEKQFDEYVDSWHRHPGVVRLWLVRAEDYEKREKPEKAEAIYDRLWEEYRGWDVLAEVAETRLDRLASGEDDAALEKFADWCIDAYADLRPKALRYKLSRAKQRAQAGEDGAVAECVELIDRIHPPKHPDWREQGLWSTVRLYLDLELAEKAADEAAKLLQPEHWSSRTFDQLKRLADRNEALKPVVAQAREKYGIPVADPDGKAAKLLEELKARIKDEQVRHMEEIGEKLFSEHKKAAATIEAVELLGEYYFRRVQPEARDKWMGRMIETYPYHPRTEKMLNTQRRAMLAGKHYEQLKQTLELIRQRFPRNVDWGWYRDRSRCGWASEEQRRQVADQVWGERVAAGEFGAMKRYVKAAFSDYQQRGRWWHEQAKRFEGTDLAVRCLLEALQYFYPVHRGDGRHHYHHRYDPLWDEAEQVILALQQQDARPEVAWQYAFDDIDVHSRHMEGKRAYEAVTERLEEGRTYRDLSRRLNLHDLGAAMGKAEMGPQVIELSRKLKRMCFTRLDLDAIEVMVAQAYAAGGQDHLAGKHLLNVVYAHPWPALRYHVFREAGNHLRRHSFDLYAGEAQRYVQRLGKAQDLAPRVLLDVGLHYARQRDRRAMTIQAQLARAYPASESLWRLMKEIRERSKR